MQNVLELMVSSAQTRKREPTQVTIKTKEKVVGWNTVQMEERACRRGRNDSMEVNQSAQGETKFGNNGGRSFGEVQGGGDKEKCIQRKR